MEEFLAKQVRLRVRMVEGEPDDEREAREFASRWQKWMRDAEAKIDGGEQHVGERDLLQELGILQPSPGKEPIRRVVNICRGPENGGGCSKGRDVEWWQCSETPRVWVCPGFLTGEECASLRSVIKRRGNKKPQNWTASGADGGKRTVKACLLGVQQEGEVEVDDAERALRAMIDGRCAGVLGTPSPDPDVPHVQLQFTPGGEEQEAGGTGTLDGAGLHIDSAHGQERRFATTIIYLNTVPKGAGGETVFPCAGRDQRVAECARYVDHYPFPRFVKNRWKLPLMEASSCAQVIGRERLPQHQPGVRYLSHRRRRAECVCNR